MKFLGKCHLVSLALHRVYGYPMVVYYGLRNGQRVLIHAGVINNQGNFEDEEGDSLEDVKTYGENLILNNPPYDRFIVYTFSQESLKWKLLLKKTGAKVRIHEYLAIFVLYYKNK